MKRNIAGRLAAAVITGTALLTAMTGQLAAKEDADIAESKLCARVGHKFEFIEPEEKCAYFVEDGYWVCSECGLYSLDGEYICLYFNDKTADHWEDGEGHAYEGGDECESCGAPYCEHFEYNLDPTSDEPFLTCIDCGEDELMRIFAIRPDSKRINGDQLHYNGQRLNENMVVEYADENGRSARYTVVLDTKSDPDEPIEIRLPVDTEEVNIRFFYENSDGSSLLNEDGIPTDKEGNPLAMVYPIPEERLESCWVYPYDPSSPQLDSIGFIHDYYMLGECVFCSDRIDCRHESITHLDEYTVSCYRRQVEMYICNDCGAAFKDKRLRKRFTLDELPMEFGPAHTVEHFEGEAASCGGYTRAEHWHCTACDAYFVDAALKKSVGYTPPLNELLEHSFDESGKCTLCNSVTTRHTGYSALIDEGVIGMRWYFTLSALDAADYDELEMSFVDENGETVHTSAIGYDPDAESDKRYFADFPVAVKNLTDTVSGRMDISDGVLETALYSVSEYLETIAAGQVEDYLEYIPLVDALLVLGGCSQIYFDYAVDRLASDRLPESTAIPEEFNRFAYEGELEDGIEFVSASLLLESYTVLNFYYASEADLSPDGLLATAQDNIWRYGIYLPPFMYDDAEACRVDVGGCSIVYTPLTYAYRTFNNESTPPELKNVCLALYDYYLAASELVTENPDAISAAYVMYSVE